MIRMMTTSIGMSPPRTFSPPSPEASVLSNKRQQEHDQQDYRQDGDHYDESPIYPPLPRSLSSDDRLGAIYTL